MIAFSTCNATVIGPAAATVKISVEGVLKLESEHLLLTRPIVAQPTVPLILNPPMLSAINGILRLQLL
jgi:hypothetical protein